MQISRFQRLWFTIDGRKQTKVSQDKGDETTEKTCESSEKTTGDRKPGTDECFCCSEP